jgi:hypothetical protein
MNRIGRDDYEQMYIGVKREYDLLLEKNQNDLIRVKIREKTLNVSGGSFRRRLGR